MIGTPSPPQPAHGGPMDRNAYIENLKSQLDKWNAEMAKWEGQAAKAKEGMRAEYEKQIAAIRVDRASAGRRRGLGGDAQGLRQGQLALQATAGQEIAA